MVSRTVEHIIICMLNIFRFDFSTSKMFEGGRELITLCKQKLNNIEELLSHLID